MRHPLPSQEFLRSVLDYSAETGVFLWRYRAGVPAQWNKRYPGTIAGRVNGNGSVEIQIDRVRYQAHRLAWVYVYGEQDMDQIDHRNMDEQDNRISNLRRATNSQNHQNKRGWHWRDLPKGVYTAKANRFRAQIKLPTRQQHLGTFDTIEEAAAAYASAAREHFGTFARVAG